VPDAVLDDAHAARHVADRGTDESLHTDRMRANDGTGTKGYTVPQHVWVAFDGRWHERKPGVLVEWRRNPKSGGWEGMVVWFSGGGNISWSGRQGWVPADHIKPLDQT